jgi:hypothetical protein
MAFGIRASSNSSSLLPRIHHHSQADVSLIYYAAFEYGFVKPNQWLGLHIVHIP